MKKYLLLAFSFIAVLYSCGNSESHQGDSLGNRNCSCVNVNDCISKNNFVKAREYASKNQGSEDQDMEKIIFNEVNYWLGEKDFARAEKVNSEIINLNESIESKNASYSKLLFIIIKALYENDKFKEALEQVDNFPEYSEDYQTNNIKKDCYLYLILNLHKTGKIKEVQELIDVLPEKIIISSRSYELPDVKHWYMTKEHEERVGRSAYEAYADYCLKNNENIEPYKGKGVSYKVFKISNLKEEAKEIINPSPTNRPSNVKRTHLRKKNVAKKIDTTSFSKDTIKKPKLNFKDKYYYIGNHKWRNKKTGKIFKEKFL